MIPYLISNIIENIEDYLARKKEEMHGQKVGRGGGSRQMEFEHYFLNKILKVIYLPSWKGLYVVFLVEAHLGITRYPGHLARQLDFRRHLERLRKDRFKCRKTYRVFVGEYRDPMAYEDFIWKYIAQLLACFDPSPESNVFAIQNLRLYYESPGAQAPHGPDRSLNHTPPSRIFSGQRNSLEFLVQNMKTPAGLSGDLELQDSLFTGGGAGDLRTPGLVRSHSSINFSDISKIEEVNQTPGGFYSVSRSVYRKKYSIEEEGGAAGALGLPQSRQARARGGAGLLHAPHPHPHPQQ